jgi:hypothetical protein
MAGFCEHDMETSGPRKVVKLLDKLNERGIPYEVSRDRHS